MLRRIGSKENIPDFIDGVKDGNERLMGFGHRVYKNYDPRAKIIKKSADDVFEVTGTNPLLDIALELEKIALEDEYFVKRKLYPNVDFYSGLIYEAFQFPPEMFTVLFAIGRTPGWLAQWLELVQDKEQKIARPKQIYTGDRTLDFTPGQRALGVTVAEQHAPGADASGPSPDRRTHVRSGPVPGTGPLVVYSVTGFSGYALLLPVAPLWAVHGGAGAAGAGLVNGVLLATTVLAQLAVPWTLRDPRPRPDHGAGPGADGGRRGAGRLRRSRLDPRLLGRPRRRLRHPDRHRQRGGRPPGAARRCAGRMVGVYGLAVAVPNLVLLPAGVARGRPGRVRAGAAPGGAALARHPGRARPRPPRPPTRHRPLPPGRGAAVTDRRRSAARAARARSSRRRPCCSPRPWRAARCSPSSRRSPPRGPPGWRCC